MQDYIRHDQTGTTDIDERDATVSKRGVSSGIAAIIVVLSLIALFVLLGRGAFDGSNDESPGTNLNVDSAPSTPR